MVHLVDAKARLKAVGERGGKVVVIDPRRSETAKIAQEHHFVRPGSDPFLLLAMIRTIFEEGLEDKEFLATHANDVEWLKTLVAAFTPERAEAQTGIDAATIRRLAREIATTQGACAFGRAVCGPFGTLQAWALDALNGELRELHATAGDYASWDDSYFFAAGRENGYAESNGTAMSMAHLDLAVFAVLDGVYASKANPVLLYVGFAYAILLPEQAATTALLSSGVGALVALGVFSRSITLPPTCKPAPAA